MEETYQQAYAQLNTAQRQAVDTIDGPVLVIAGPGTGKTQLLSMRVANILRQTDVNAGNILCLTFTESGQQAIQRRLLDLIGEAGNKVSIHTFHAFGAAIITATPDYFYEAAGARAADDLTLFEILHAIFEKLPHGGPLSSHNGEEFLFLKDTQQRISQLKASGLTPNQLRALVAADETWCKSATPLVQTTYQQFSRIHNKYLPVLERLAEDLSRLETHATPLDWLQPLAHACLGDLTAALETARTNDNMASLSSWKSRWLENVNGELQFKTRGQHQRLKVLADVYENYTAGLRRRHLFDYDDMILDVLQALTQHVDLLASLQEQYQYILVDEYQDTNPAQAKLLELLADNPVHEGRPNIMVVGDDDQAVYGFQGADASVMLRFRQHWRNVTTIVLTDNYRSSQAILDTARQLILQGETRLENLYDDIVKQLAARLTPAGDKPQLIKLSLEVDQYIWLVAEIKHLLEKGVEPREIAVIAPRHKYLQRLVPYLLEAGVAINYERRANVLKDPVVMQLLQLLKLVDAVRQQNFGEVRSLLPEVLSYPWWGVPARQVWALSLEHADTADTWLDQMLDDGEELGRFGAWLVDIAQLAATQNLETVLDSVLQGLDQQLDSQSLQIQLDSIIRGLQLYQPETKLTLNDFIRYVSLCRQANIAVEATETIITDNNAIRLLTAHKAKGLEFGFVFAIDVTEHIWAAEKGMINKLGLPPNLTIQPAGATPDDRLRLLYVTVTRARTGLYFTAFDQADDGKLHQPLSWLAVPEVQHTIRRLEPKIAGKSALLAAPTKYDWRLVHHQQLADKRLRDYLQPFLKDYRLSPTHLTTFLDVPNGGPRHFLVRHLLQFPEATSLNMVYGNVLHRLLEQAQSSVANGSGVIPVGNLIKELETVLAAYNLREVDFLRLQERGRRTLETYLTERADGFVASNLAEYNFRNEVIQLGEASLTGKIDRLGLDAKTMVAHVTDFKTGRAFNKWQASTPFDKHKLHRYEQQLLFYKVLVEHSKAFNGYRVDRGYLEFIEPDKWGRLNTLEYDYTPAAQQRLQQLINVVWQKIISLDLPDVSAYSPDFKGVLAFEEDLLEGKL